MFSKFMTLGNPVSSTTNPLGGGTDSSSLESGLSSMIDPLLDDDSIFKIDPKKEKYKPKGPPMKCPTYVNALCMGGGFILVCVAIGVFLGYYYGFRNPDEGFTKDTVYWVVGLCCAVLAGMCCISFGGWCCCFRARCWWDRKQAKREKQAATELAGLKRRRRERWEEGAENRSKHDAIREKYGLSTKNLDAQL